VQVNHEGPPVETGSYCRSAAEARSQAQNPGGSSSSAAAVIRSAPSRPGDEPIDRLPGVRAKILYKKNSIKGEPYIPPAKEREGAPSRKPRPEKIWETGRRGRRPEPSGARGGREDWVAMDKKSLSSSPISGTRRNASPHTWRLWPGPPRVAAYLKDRGFRWDKPGTSSCAGYLAAVTRKKRKKTTIGRKLAALRSFYDSASGPSACPRPRPRSWRRRGRTSASRPSSRETMRPSSSICRARRNPGLRDKAILELLYATGIRCPSSSASSRPDHPLSGEARPGPRQGQEGRIVPFAAKPGRQLEAYGQAGRARRGREEGLLRQEYRGGRLTTRSVQRMVHQYIPPASPAYQPAFPPPVPSQSHFSSGRGGGLASSGASRPCQPGHDEKYTHVDLRQLLAVYKKSHPRG